MSTESQIEANRLNAQHSTGPVTVEGKSRSRLNAVRDNITGQVTSLDDEDRAVFNQILNDHIAALKPDGAEELRLAHSIAWDQWRLDRIRAIEMNLFASGVAREGDSEPDDAETWIANAKRLELMSLYESRMNRTMSRNRQTLRDLQNDRLKRQSRAREEEIMIARYMELKEKPYTAPDPAANIGFVFSEAEIAAAAARQRTLEMSAWFLTHTEAWRKYGPPGTEDPTEFILEPYYKPPTNIKETIHGISPESIAIRKFYYPEEFNGKHKR